MKTVHGPSAVTGTHQARSAACDLSVNCPQRLRAPREVTWQCCSALAAKPCPCGQPVTCCIAFLTESLLLQGLGDTMSERDIDDLFTLAGRLLRELLLCNMLSAAAKPASGSGRLCLGRQL